jgi:hypothetical protein
MKKLLILTLLATGLCANQLEAQDSKVDDLFKTYRFGLFVGPTFNSLKPTSTVIDNYTITKGKGNVGFTFGINMDYNINDRYTIFSGLGLDWRGGEISATIKDTTQALNADFVKKADVTYKLQYLTIPLGLKMKATEFGKVKIYAQTGFDLGILLSNKGNYAVTKSDNTKDAQDKTKLKGIATAVPVNIGWHIGPGIEYNLGKNSCYASLLYRNGFIDATSPKTNKTGYKFSDGNIRSNSFAIRVGYFF